MRIAGDPCKKYADVAAERIRDPAEQEVDDQIVSDSEEDDDGDDEDDDDDDDDEDEEGDEADEVARESGVSGEGTLGTRAAEATRFFLGMSLGDIAVSR